MQCWETGRGETVEGVRDLSIYVVRGSVWQLRLHLSLYTSVSVCACDVCSCGTDHEQLFVSVSVCSRYCNVM